MVYVGTRHDCYALPQRKLKTHPVAAYEILRSVKTLGYSPLNIHTLILKFAQFLLDRVVI